VDVFPPQLSKPAGSRHHKDTDNLGIYLGYVGDGDAILLKLPGGKVALIDAGDSSMRELDPPPVTKLLNKHKIKHIDFLVLSHPHSDHIGGMPYIVKNYQIGAFYSIALTMPREIEEVRIRDELYKLLVAKNIPINFPAEGDWLDWFPGGKVRVLNAAPKAGITTSSSQMNNASLVLQMNYAGQTALFTGDIELETEARLVRTYGDSLKSNILKVAHHGSNSASSASFLKAVSPETALISASKDSMYGFPRPEVLARLDEAGASVLSTADGKPKEQIITPPPPPPPQPDPQ